MNIKIGYIRVSTKEQNLDRQIALMLSEGIEERYIFKDMQSGRNFDREGYKAMKQILREGDILFVEDIDRLGRNFDLIINEWQDIRKKGVDIIALNNKDLFNSLKFKELGELGKFLENQFISIFAYISSSEREKMLKRQKEGIEVSKNKGVKFGRPALPKLNASIISKWQNNEIAAVDAIKELNCSKSSFYKYINNNKIKKNNH